MPGPNAEIIKRALVAWNERDQRAIDELLTGIGRQSRIPVRFIEATVVTIRDKRIARIEVCDSRAAALDVAGASD